MFDNAYAAATNSAPSRACMMTGMYTPRHGVYTVSPPDRGDRTKRKYIAIPNVEDVCADFVTMAEALQEQGYQCGHIGKWHLGMMRTVQDPCHRDLYGMWAVIEQELPILIFIPYCLPDKSKCHVGLEEGILGEYLTDRLTEEAVSFIKSHSRRSFFLHLSHHAVHTVLQTPDSLINKYRNKTPGKYHKNPIYAAMIEN